MQVVLEEARDSYESDKIWQLKSDTVEEMEDNVHRIDAWVDAFTSSLI